jgi:hypothetical protein
MKIARESWIIATIGLADLVTTIVFIKHHGAQEANPLFSHLLATGLIAFIVAKLACLVGPLVVLEWARARRAQFVKYASRTVILAYLVLYGIGVAHLNGPRAQANELARYRGHPSMNARMFLNERMMMAMLAQRHTSMARWHHFSTQTCGTRNKRDGGTWHPSVTRHASL